MKCERSNSKSKTSSFLVLSFELLVWEKIQFFFHLGSQGRFIKFIETEKDASVLLFIYICVCGVCMMPFKS